jgi:hypothetical protein
MSIVALKRKTNAKYNNMSVGSTQGFSINGTHRNQGFVGQTSLSRSLPRTLMKGNTPKGNGGCCGTYNKTTIVQSGVTSVEDSTVVKSSVSGTNGMLTTQFRWVRRPYPYAVVKPDNTLNANTQHEYITRLKKLTLNKVENIDCAINKTVTGYKSGNVCDYTKAESDYLSVSCNEYIMKIQDGCTENDILYVKKSTLRHPYV